MRIVFVCSMEHLLDTCGLLRVRCLLLIYLCVLEAAAACSKPQGGNNMVLSNDAILMNEFPENTTVTLECANGYVKENGSGQISCSGGNWTEPDLTCKKKDCGSPKPQPNMSFNISGGTLFGDVIKVICDKGYQITGASYKQCFNTGWVGRAKCLIVTCEMPADLYNGRSSWDSKEDPIYGTVIRYSCNEGYSLIGNDTITCTETGRYDSDPPQCQEASSFPDSISHRDETTTTSTVLPSEGVLITTKLVASTPTLRPTQEASSFPDSTSHRDETTTTSTVLPSEGSRDIMASGDKDKASTTSGTTPTPSPFKGVLITTKSVASTPTPSQTQEASNSTNSASQRDKATTTSTVLPSEEQQSDTVDTLCLSGYTTAIICGICVLAAVLVLAIACKHVHSLKRKGSYDTKEDLKPELLQFQNL